MSDEREVVTLADAHDTWNFRVGDPVQMVWCSDGQLRRPTRWQRLTMAVGDWLRWRTRWFRPRTVCSEIDRAEGRIVMQGERWSWRRWRWERM